METAMGTNQGRGLFIVGVILVVLCVLAVFLNALFVTMINSVQWESNSNTIFLRLVLDGVLGLVGISLILFDRRKRP